MKYGDTETNLKPKWLDRPKICTVIDCNNSHKAAGLCHKHYQRQLKYGDVNILKSKPNIGYVNAGGYRVIRVNGKQILEHRFTMETCIGRKLLPSENVHHKNGNKLDNRIENLELWVTTQPAGKRPEDLVRYAKEILALYDV